MTTFSKLPKNILQKKLKLYDLSFEVLVYLSATAWEKIQYLCTYISKVEWSGCMFYAIDGDLSKPETIRIEVVDIIPLDKGTTGFTEYSFDSRVLSYLMEKDYFHLKIGHIHSHHSMKTFFSGTDTDEILENSEHIKPYLSVIVNNDYDFSAKLAFKIKTISPTIFEYQNIDNSITQLSFNEEDEYVANYNCKVISPMKVFQVDDTFKSQFAEINKPKPQPKVQFTKLGNGKQAPFFRKDEMPSNQVNLFDETDWWNSNSPLITTSADEYGGMNWNNQELLFCKILRLGIEIPLDTLERALEDLENSIMQDETFNINQYVASIKSKFKVWVKEFKQQPVLLKSELDVVWEDFIDELMFSADEFVAVHELLELLLEQNTL